MTSEQAKNLSKEAQRKKKTIAQLTGSATSMTQEQRDQAWDEYVADREKP